MTDVIDNTTRRRFELHVDGKIVYADYRRTDTTVQIPYVEAPPSLRGTGAADRLMQGVVELVRRDGLRLVPICAYAVAWARRHPEMHDLLE